MIQRDTAQCLHPLPLELPPAFIASGSRVISVTLLRADRYDSYHYYYILIGLPWINIGNKIDRSIEWQKDAFTLVSKFLAIGNMSLEHEKF